MKLNSSKITPVSLINIFTGVHIQCKYSSQYMYVVCGIFVWNCALQCLQNVAVRHTATYISFSGWIRPNNVFWNWW